MKKLVSNLLISAFLTLNVSYADDQAIAQSVNASTSLAQIVQTYDYQLTTSPQAGDDAFQQATLEQMQAELSQAAQGKTSEELKAEMTEILSGIDSAEQREALQTQIDLATQQELMNMLQNPALLSSSLHGQGSNFVFDDAGSNALVIIAGVAIVALLVLSVRADLRTDDWYSFSIEYQITDFETCSAYDLFGFERDEMRADARAICLSRAALPDTCSFHRYDVDRFGNRCSIQAVYRSDKVRN